MNCSQGDLAHIIKSVDGLSVGKTVQCVTIVGTHSLFGPIWRVRCKDVLVTEYGAMGNEVDVPDSWLKKIEPPKQKDKNVEKNLVIQ